jgi:hypothetical protein
MGHATKKPIPFRGAVGVGTVSLFLTSVGDKDSPHPNPSAEGEGL